MAKDVSGKGSWKEEFLALVFVLVFFISFVFVAYVDANWETTTTEQVWVSDGDAIIPHYDAEFKGTGGVVILHNETPSYRVKINSGDWFQNDTTALYVGNNTWYAPFEEQTESSLGSYTYMVFEIDDAQAFLMNGVDYRLYSGGLTPDRISITLLVYSLDGEIDTGPENTDYDILASATIFDDLAPSGTYWNGTASVSLANALNIYQKAQIPNTVVVMNIKFNHETSGWPLHEASYTITVNGTYQKGLSASDMIYYGLGFSTGINILVGLFMTDRIDMDTIAKALRRK